jgi:hypothetical protein
MVFRIFYRIIYGYIDNEKLISRLSQSYPIRRAAQLVFYAVHRSRKSIEDNLNGKQFLNDIKENTSNRLTQFKHRFETEFRNELNNAKEELKRKNK